MLRGVDAQYERRCGGSGEGVGRRGFFGEGGAVTGGGGGWGHASRFGVRSFSLRSK